MVAGAIAGNISAEATTPTGNIFAEAMRGVEATMALELERAPQAGGAQAVPRDSAAGARMIVVGLINNMPDSALEGTESQFVALLSAACGPHTVRLRVSSIPEVPRGPEARARSRPDTGRCKDYSTRRPTRSSSRARSPGRPRPGMFDRSDRHRLRQEERRHISAHF